jgi:hypothetical protein
LLFGVCAVLVLIATWLGLVGPDSPPLLLATSACLLAASIGLVRSKAVHTLQTAQTLCVLFFLLAVAHVSSGFLLADLTTEHTSIRSNAETAYATALLINSIGLLAAAAGYVCTLQSGFAAAFSRLDTDSRLANKIFSVLVGMGAVLMFLVYWHLHFLDFAAAPSQWPYMRYVTSDLMHGSATDEWLVNRAMDLLTVSLPFVLFCSARRPTLFNGLLCAIGYLALLLPLRRANLIGVTLAFLILWGVSRGNAYRFTRKMVFIAGGLYLASQCLFLVAAFAVDVAPSQVLTVSSTAFPEVRDLAWINSLLDGDRLHGVTFAQALFPLPSIASDWSSTHSLRAITTKLIGMDESRETGGLRLTIFGEGYVNFGYFGAIAAGFLWGMAVGWCEKLLQRPPGSHSGFRDYVAVMCFVWICFFFYLAGTQAAASMKVEGLLLILVAWAARRRTQLGQVGMVTA